LCEQASADNSFKEPGITRPVPVPTMILPISHDDF
jgi:hypothetical protein